MVIFILLCLTSFATLSLTTATADRNLTERTAAATREYYDADARAEEMLARIDQLLVDARQGAGSREAYFASCAKLLEQEFPELNAEPGDSELAVRYTIPCGERSELVVRLRVLAEGAERYTLEEWRLSPTGDWQPQPGGFELWDGAS